MNEKPQKCTYESNALAFLSCPESIGGRTREAPGARAPPPLLGKNLLFI